MVQKLVKEKGITLISTEEIKAIELLWIYEGDNISSIADVINFDNMFEDNSNVFEHKYRNNNLDIEKLQKVCEINQIPPTLVEQLLIVENDLSRLSRRTGIYDRLEKVIEEYVINEMKTENGTINENS